MDSANHKVKLTPGKAAIALVFVVICVVAYIALALALAIEPFYPGFFFAFYFAGLKGGDLGEFPAAVAGSLGGLLVAALQHILPEHFGTTGMVVALLVIVAAIYALLMEWAAIVINNAFMLMLTVGTIPAVVKESAYLGMAESVVLAAVFLWGLLQVAGLLTARAKRAVQSA